MAENEEELKSLWMKVKEESERVDVGLKFNIQKTNIMASGPITSRQIESGNSDIFYFLVLQNHFRQWPQPWNSKMFAPWQKSYDKPRLCIKKQRHYFADKGPSGESYSFSSSHVWMWELDHKEEWVLKNWCFQTVVLEKTVESPLESKKIKLVNHRGN